MLNTEAVQRPIKEHIFRTLCWVRSVGCWLWACPSQLRKGFPVVDGEHVDPIAV